jgi:hypothetical protein
VLGDINESNMLVSSDALITMVLYQWFASPASPQNAIFKLKVVRPSLSAAIGALSERHK